ncbi:MULTISPECIES: SPFH domain-containing protein [Bacillaceae]|uniref:Band 7 domain-containing protein n=1 Tax=Gottfriedia luciferensis TaxID=178774 RepID=A0ABX2ZT41_9BACI|nr:MULTISPECIES: SPFH domain-containing protein [Bacillaceae]ODG92960.1 hypothetical protein BED47_17425 [Gottfriedia luciferensis]PGZ93988.1 hypothetical protein COE53_04515 [Bacillus sp. AFS029533]SFD75567.1 SPFH domain / Band 7 family protein [Bacillus sp. UNCCL81]
MNGLRSLIAGGVIIVGGIIYAIGGMSHISVGSIGIEKHMSGEITEVPQGFHWTGWGVSVQEYPTYTQSLVLSSDKHEGGNSDQEWSVGTGDQQELPVNTNLTWKISTKNVANLYQSVGGKDISYIKNNIVKPTMKNVVNKITHKYSWNDIKGSKQADITEEINTALDKELAKQGIEVGTFGFTHVGSPAGMAQSQAQLATSELNVKKALADQEKAKIENQTKILNAEADAKSNKILSDSLTPELLKKMEMDARQKWGWVTVQGGTPLVQAK